MLAKAANEDAAAGVGTAGGTGGGTGGEAVGRAAGTDTAPSYTDGIPVEQPLSADGFPDQVAGIDTTGIFTAASGDSAFHADSDSWSAGGSILIASGGGSSDAHHLGLAVTWCRGAGSVGCKPRDG